MPAVSSPANTFAGSSDRPKLSKVFSIVVKRERERERSFFHNHKVTEEVVDYQGKGNILSNVRVQ